MHMQGLMEYFGQQVAQTLALSLCKRSTLLRMSLRTPLFSDLAEAASMLMYF